MAKLCLATLHTLQINDYCSGCGPSLASCTCSCPPCFGYFRHLFGTRYVLEDKDTSKNTCTLYGVCLLSYNYLIFLSLSMHQNTEIHWSTHSQNKAKEDMVLVCMIYYPDENNAPSWANASLGALGYDRNPDKVQLLIRKFFEEATRYAMLLMIVEWPTRVCVRVICILKYRFASSCAPPIYCFKVPLKCQDQKSFPSLSSTHWMEGFQEIMLLELSHQPLVEGKWQSTCWMLFIVLGMMQDRLEIRLSQHQLLHS